MDLQAAHHEIFAPQDESYPRPPLKLSGALDSYAFTEVTPVIGREYRTLQLRDLLNASNADDLIRELAIVISRRGVVFFRGQEITPEEQKQLTQRIGLAAGKPTTSNLHIHPVFNSQRNAQYQTTDAKGTINKDDEISVISSKLRKEVLELRDHKSGAEEWHSDITFEPAPADYTSLKVHTLPFTGGDTLWCSAYEIYDLLSRPFQDFVSGLIGRYAQPGFERAAETSGFELHAGPRGSPLNVGKKLEAYHPFVRTNPVTGWRSVFGVGSHFDRIVNLDLRESRMIKDYILGLVTSSHAAQVRFRWEANDVAIWDNRSAYHAATPDYYGLGDRGGVRAVSVGEKPYLDQASASRRDELGQSKLI